MKNKGRTKKWTHRFMILERVQRVHLDDSGGTSGTREELGPRWLARAPEMAGDSPEFAGEEVATCSFNSC